MPPSGGKRLGAFPILKASTLSSSRTARSYGDFDIAFSRGIQSGDLETIKVGRATLVQYRSLKLLTGNVVPGVGETADLRQSPPGTPST